MPLHQPQEELVEKKEEKGKEDESQEKKDEENYESDINHGGMFEQ